MAPSVSTSNQLIALRSWPHQISSVQGMGHRTDQRLAGIVVSITDIDAVHGIRSLLHDLQLSRDCRFLVFKWWPSFRCRLTAQNGATIPSGRDLLRPPGAWLGKAACLCSLPSCSERIPSSSTCATWGEDTFPAQYRLRTTGSWRFSPAGGAESAAATRFQLDHALQVSLLLQGTSNNQYSAAALRT